MWKGGPRTPWGCAGPAEPEPSGIRPCGVRNRTGQRELRGLAGLAAAGRQRRAGGGGPQRRSRCAGLSTGQAWAPQRRIRCTDHSTGQAVHGRNAGFGARTTAPDRRCTAAAPHRRCTGRSGRLVAVAPAAAGWSLRPRGGQRSGTAAAAAVDPFRRSSSPTALSQVLRRRGSRPNPAAAASADQAQHSSTAAPQVLRRRDSRRGLQSASQPSSAAAPAPPSGAAAPS
jgi:hypothetical protein